MATRVPKARDTRTARSTTKGGAATRSGGAPTTRKATAGRGATRTGSAPQSRPVRERKNMRIDQRLLDDAKRILGTETETEAVTIALQRIVGNERILAGIRALAGTKWVDASLIDEDYVAP
jgi:Arc/MetJ family transcription regulator